MPGKRQHYIPRFTFRRLSIDLADEKSHILRLDKRSGRNGAEELLDHFETTPPTSSSSSATRHTDAA